MNALKRGQELLTLSLSRVPELATMYANHLARSKSGACIEAALTAFATYAELVGGLEPSPDPTYRADTAARRWFEDQGVDIIPLSTAEAEDELKRLHDKVRQRLVEYRQVLANGSFWNENTDKELMDLISELDWWGQEGK